MQEVQSLVLKINCMLEVGESFQFLAERDECENVFERLAVCRAWWGRVESLIARAELLTARQEHRLTVAEVKSALAKFEDPRSAERKSFRAAKKIYKLTGQVPEGNLFKGK